MSDIDRFLLKIHKTKDGCWLWVGAKTGSIAKFRYGKNMGNAKRFIFEHEFGEVLDEYYPINSCKEDFCVNPHHLKLEHVSLNKAYQKKRDRKFCPQGHQDWVVRNNGHYGSRKCKACDRERSARTREKKKKGQKSG